MYLCVYVYIWLYIHTRTHTLCRTDGSVVAVPHVEEKYHILLNEGIFKAFLKRKLKFSYVAVKLGNSFVSLKHECFDDVESICLLKCRWLM